MHIWIIVQLSVLLSIVCIFKSFPPSQELGITGNPVYLDNAECDQPSSHTTAPEVALPAEESPKEEMLPECMQSFDNFYVVQY